MSFLSRHAATLAEFDDHKVVVLDDEETGLLALIAIHRQIGRNPSLGATRFANYASGEDALRDALQLSRLGTYKAALAGLPYGGAKGVLIAPSGPYERTALLRAYAARVEQLGGVFVTGADAGIDVAELELMREHCGYIIGHIADAPLWTAKGVLNAIKTVLGELFGSPEIRGRRIAVQGLGKTGFELVRLLHERGARLVVADCRGERCESVRQRFGGVNFVDAATIHQQHADVFSPCALSGAINAETFPELRCGAIAGSANGQLSGPELGKALFDRGILYAPDYVVNAGGLISVADELVHGDSLPERFLPRISGISTTLKRIFRESQSTRQSTDQVAEAMARRVVAAANGQEAILKKSA